MNCPSCGNSLKPEARFCTKCGKTLVGPFSAGAAAGPAKSKPDPVAGMIPPPPPLNSTGGYTPYVPPPETIAEKGNKEVFYKQKETSEATISKIKPAHIVVSVVVLLVIVGFTAMHFYDVFAKPYAGRYELEGLGLSFVLPDKNWFIDEEAAEKSGLDAPYFFRGRRKPSNLKLEITYNDMKYEISDRMVERGSNDIAKGYVEWITEYLKRTRSGAKYEHLNTGVIPLGGNTGLWLEGNVITGAGNTRLFTFVAFNKMRAYTMEFYMNENDVETLWSEVESILNSVTFEE